MFDWETELRQEFDGEDGSFLITLRCGLKWDEEAYDRLVQLMKRCIADLEGMEEIPRWIANGFWFTDSFVMSWTSHPDFPREQDQAYYDDAWSEISCLAHALFVDDRAGL